MPSFETEADTRLSVFDSHKGLSNTFKTHKNISLYFKRRYLIIYYYCQITSRNSAKDKQKYQPVVLLVFSESHITKFKYANTKNIELMDVKSWTQPILLSKLCPPGGFLQPIS